MNTILKSLALFSVTALTVGLLAFSPTEAQAASRDQEMNRLQQQIRNGGICEIDGADFKEVRDDGHPAMLDKVMVDGHSYRVAKISQDYTSLRHVYRYLKRHDMDSHCVIVPLNNWYYARYTGE